MSLGEKNDGRKDRRRKEYVNELERRKVVKLEDRSERHGFLDTRRDGRQGEERETDRPAKWQNNINGADRRRRRYARQKTDGDKDGRESDEGGDEWTEKYTGKEKIFEDEVGGSEWVDNNSNVRGYT